jgi:hypothetical protein
VPAKARVCALLLCAGTGAGATPNLPLEDPVYLLLAQLHAQGRLPAYLGGSRPLTEAEVQRLLTLAGVAPDPLLLPAALAGFWARPAALLTARAALVDEHLRPYSTAVRPRDLAGFLALSCEHQEGLPCGPGAGLGLEVDSSAGYGRWASAYTRLRVGGGTHAYAEGLEIDRAYLNFELGPLALEVGRDVQVLGPAARSALMLSDNAAPFDHARISTAHPIDILGENGSLLRLSLRYFIARLRDPQRFHGTLLTGSRAQIDLFDGLEVGGTRLLQLGGEGAPGFGGLGGFIVEHFRRQTGPTGAGVSNNRLSFDAAYVFRGLRGARVYYELAFEDTRSQFFNALEYQTDHLLGIEVVGLDAAGRHGWLVEVHRTGVDSHEHSLYTTGMTNAERTLGSPLGPDAWSVYARGRIDLPAAAISPWAEIAHLSSDVYGATETGPIVRVSEGIAERRYRLGLDARFDLRPRLSLQLAAFAERAGNADLAEGATRFNAGLRGALSWTP